MSMTEAIRCPRADDLIDRLQYGPWPNEDVMIIIPVVLMDWITKGGMIRGDGMLQSPGRGVEG